MCSLIWLPGKKLGRTWIVQRLANDACGQLRDDCRDNAVDIFVNRRIRKSYDLEAPARQELRALRVSPFACIGEMTGTIDLDDKPRGQTAEVRDIGADDDLPAKMCLGQRDSIADRAPKLAFSACHGVTHSFRAAARERYAAAKLVVPIAHRRGFLIAAFAQPHI